MTFNYGGGLAGGFAQGLQIGQSINDMMKEDAVAKVRAQGIAEAKAMQAAQTPQVADQGDASNLSSVPQASPDPAATPVNTNLVASPAMAGVVAPTAPDADPNAPLSSAPQASSDPNAAAAPDVATPVSAQGMLMAGRKRYMVVDQGFDDLASAQKHAASQAPDLYDIMRKTVVPKMQDMYMQQGDLDKAAALDKWAQDADGRDYMKKYSQAVMASQAGDWDKAVDIMHDLHKGFNDGFTISDKSDVKDANGNLIGKKVTYTNDATGETKSEVMDPKALVMMGLPGLSPDKAFEKTYASQTAADAAAAREAADNRNDARTAQRQAANSAAVSARDMTLQDKKFVQDKELKALESTNRIAEEAAKKQIDIGAVGPTYTAKLRAQVDAMRNEGKMSEDDIQGAIQTLVGADSTKKTTDPVERRMMLTTEALKADPRFGKKTEDEKNQYIDALMRVGGGKLPNVKIPRRTDGTPLAPAAAAGVPQAAPVKTSGTPVWDPATNKMVYR